MPLITNWEINLEADHILRAQGADPEVIRWRKPSLLKTAEWALMEGLPLLKPAALYIELPVKELRHERVYVKLPEANEQKSFLSGALLSNHLGPAEKLAVVVCTVGEALETVASELMPSDLLEGLALDAVGSAAAEALGNAVCAFLETKAEGEGLQATLPLSPGMVAWPVSEGQPQIFHLLENELKKHPEFQVRLTPDDVMQPRKSVSFVMGFGSQVDKQGKTCDFCAMKETCRYQNHYA
jgi:hypothetical protein